MRVKLTGGMVKTYLRDIKRFERVSRGLYFLRCGADLSRIRGLCEDFKSLYVCGDVILEPAEVQNFKVMNSYSDKLESYGRV